MEKELVGGGVYGCEGAGGCDGMVAAGACCPYEGAAGAGDGTGTVVGMNDGAEGAAGAVG